MFSFRYFFKKRLVCVLDSYFIPRYIIIKYGQVRFRIEYASYYESNCLFSTSFFAKYLRVGEDGPGRGHLCHTDTFLVLTILNLFYNRSMQYTFFLS